MFKRISRIIAASIAAMALMLPTLSLTASAKEGDEYKVHVSPSIQEIDLKPGEVYRGSFEIINSGNEAFKYTLKAEPYSVVDERYTPNFEERTAYNMMADWIKFDLSTGTLAGNSRSDANFTITVPKDVSEYTQHAALTILVDNEEEGMVRSSTRVASILLARVEGGETRHDVVISNHKINGFLFNPPITATALVENKGNVDEAMSTYMKVYPIFSGEEIYTNEENPDTGTILVGTRYFSTSTWQNSPRIGIYRVVHTIEIGGETSTVSKVVVICPIWVLVLILIFIAAVVFWLVSNRKARKAGERAEAKLNEKK